MALEGDDRSAAPQGTSDDSTAMVAGGHAAIASTPAGQVLNRFIEAANAGGEGAEEYYNEALEDLKSHADGVLVEIARSLGHCDEEDYTLRWTLIHAATELRDERAMALLQSVARTPIEDEKFANAHSRSSVKEETILRTTAIDGISLLASRGSEQATDTLFDLLDLPSLSVRRAAVAGLLASPRGEEYLDRIAQCLPDDQRFLVELQKADVREFEQVKDPTAHLSEKGRAATTERPPEFGRVSESGTKGSSPSRKADSDGERGSDDPAAS